jgi:hypothetical protein
MDVPQGAQHDAQRLQRGPKLPFFAGPLPSRAIAALAVFVAAFVVVWIGLWALIGTLGLAAGWIVAAVAGFAAVRLVTRRAWGGG